MVINIMLKVLLIELNLYWTQTILVDHIYSVSNIWNHIAIYIHIYIYIYIYTYIYINEVKPVPCIWFLKLFFRIKLYDLKQERKKKKNDLFSKPLYASLQETCLLRTYLMNMFSLLTIKSGWTWMHISPSIMFPAVLLSTQQMQSSQIIVFG